MSMKTLLVPLSGDKMSVYALDLALLLARTMTAHVTVLHARADPRDTVPLVGEGLSTSMIEEFMEAATVEADRRSEIAHNIFEAALEKASVPLVDPSPAPGEISASFVEEIGHVGDIVGRMGRLSDLVVVSRPEEESVLDEADTLNAALFETGKPVLVAPARAVTTIGRRMAIAWNGSAEAARAISAAMEFIEQSDEAVVLSVGDKGAGVDSIGPLAEYLEWHGADPKVNTIKANGAPIGTTLLDACKTADADLLVMGAYTHSRMRELILGGVTREILASSDMPLLMAH